MYSEKDYADIARRVRKNWLLWTPVLLGLLALMIVGLAVRVKWLAVSAAGVLGAAAVFAFTFCQLPCLRYRSFLQDLREGLNREMTGEIVSIAQKPELQDGARVLPVILKIPDGDERIVYLNASKRQAFPEPGASVRLKLCGRHILNVELSEGKNQELKIRN